jgi:DNA-binding response OmpR family regulator
MDTIAMLCENAHPEVTFSSKELKVFQILAQGKTKRETLLVDVFAFTTDMVARKGYKTSRSADVTIGRMRKKLAPLGIGIESLREYGYQLTF